VLAVAPPVSPVIAPVPAPHTASAIPAVHAELLGFSVLGRRIIVRVVGDPQAPRRILVVGCVHGDETGGLAISRRLRRTPPPQGTVWWVLDEANPDGCRAHTRQNAHGVDLNRNSPWQWRRRGRPGSAFYSGPRPLSEPESRVINTLVRRVRPAVSVWFHQHAGLVDRSSGGSVAIERRYAARVGLPLRGYGVFRGSITTWQDSVFPQDTAFVVELPAGEPSPAAIARHVAAIAALGTRPAGPRLDPHGGAAGRAAGVP
jgi:protein MpaA